MVGMKGRSSSMSGYRDAHFAQDRRNLEQKRRQGKEHASRDQMLSTFVTSWDKNHKVISRNRSS